MNLFGGEHEREAPLEERREGGFADDAAEKGEGVRADLDGGEELAGMFLQVEDESGAAVAVVRKYVESGAAEAREISAQLRKALRQTRMKRENSSV